MKGSKSIWDKNGKVAEINSDGYVIWLRPGSNTGNKMSSLPSPMVMRDIEPYKSMITGEMITSRSVHKTHLKQHGCVEVGNDTSHMKPKPVKHDFRKRKQILASQLADKSDKQIKTMINNEIKLRKNTLG